MKALARRMPIFTSAVYLNQCVELDLGERNKQAMTGCEQSLALEAAPQVLKAMISYMSVHCRKASHPSSFAVPAQHKQFVRHRGLLTQAKILFIKPIMSSIPQQGRRCKVLTLHLATAKPKNPRTLNP